MAPGRPIHEPGEHHLSRPYDVQPPEGDRNRLTAAFRICLAIPHPCSSAGPAWAAPSAWSRRLQCFSPPRSPTPRCTFAGEGARTPRNPLRQPGRNYENRYSDAGDRRRVSAGRADPFRPHPENRRIPRCGESAEGSCEGRKEAEDLTRLAPRPDEGMIEGARYAHTKRRRIAVVDLRTRTPRPASSGLPRRSHSPPAALWTSLS